MNDLNKNNKKIRLLRIVLNSVRLSNFIKMKKINFKKNDELNEKITTLKKRSIYENYVDDIFSKLINTENGHAIKS
jgi:hypothetical protein